jgi:chitin disaccharide deacetylase
VLCADDFGLAPDVNDGILRLVEAGRITAVSCLVEGPAWNLGAADLARVADRADVGLHLFLGTGSGGGALAFAARGVLGLVDASEVERQIRGQLDRFEKDCGRQPVFVDGHHHVHQMWPVREVLLRVLRERYQERVPYVRNTVPLHPRGAKGAVIAALGGHALLRLLREERFPHNTDFAGVYDLSPRSDFRSLMRAWLDSIADRGLLMCHPGLPVQGLDRFAAARIAELRHLESDRFGEDCEAALVRLVRPSEATA